jgi:hypothetical protein
MSLTIPVSGETNVSGEIFGKLMRTLEIIMKDVAFSTNQKRPSMLYAFQYIRQFQAMINYLTFQQTLK